MKIVEFLLLLSRHKTEKISSNFQNKTKTEKTEKVQINCRNVNGLFVFCSIPRYCSGWRLEIAFLKTDATN